MISRGVKPNPTICMAEEEILVFAKGENLLREVSNHLIIVAGFLTAWDFSSTSEKLVVPGKIYNGLGAASPKGPIHVRMSRMRQ
jgi:hypothetical protein